MNGETYFKGERLSELHLSEKELAAFTGEYRGAELDGAIVLSLDGENLTLKIHDDHRIKLVPIGSDEFDAGGSFSIVFHRDGLGKVSGLGLFAPAARGIEFARAK